MFQSFCRPEYSSSLSFCRARFSLPTCTDLCKRSVLCLVFSSYRPRPTFFPISLISTPFIFGLFRNILSPLCVLRSRASPYTANLRTSTASGGRRNMNRSLLTIFVKTFQIQKLSDKLRISSLNMSEFLRCVVEENTAPSQQVVLVLNPTTESRRL